MLVDSFCENGCIFSKTVIADVKYAHRGTRISTDFGPVIENRFKQAELNSIKSAIEESTRLACEETNFEAFKTLIESSNERKIDGSIPQVLERVGKHIGLSKTDVEGVKVAMNFDEATQFGVQAAITKLAQSVKSYDKRISLEEAGGKVLEMGAHTWEAINKLA
jgi:rRNA maturation endonuclease Nob1